MRSGDSQHVATLQHVLGQPLRAAGVGQACVQNRFHQREFRCAVGQMSAADDVADDEHVWLQRELIGPEAFDQFNAQGAKLVAHRRIDPGVAAGDCVARLTRQCSQTAHESAADAENVNVHGFILSGFCRI